jgi:DNA-binding transcriptional MerR regulator/predicted enzyme related to lactoylglutathione lyase
VSDDNLLSIGGFAMVSGLSIAALRHYDEVDLLKPASVDPATGYRRYHPEQVEQGRLIHVLRAVDLPIDAIRGILGDPDEASMREVLSGHQNRLLQRAHSLSQMACTVGHYIEHGVSMPNPVRAPRIAQVVINVTDLKEAIDFYDTVFGVSFNEDISSFEFGTWPSDEFFLVTVANGDDRPGPVGSSRFGLMVAELDQVHRRALEAGAIEMYAPVETSWKPRSSCVADPSGNLIDLYQG